MFSLFDLLTQPEKLLAQRRDIFRSVRSLSGQRDLVQNSHPAQFQNFRQRYHIAEISNRRARRLGFVKGIFEHFSYREAKVFRRIEAKTTKPSAIRRGALSSPGNRVEAPGCAFARQLGHTYRGARDARRHPRLVHRGFDTADLKDAKALLDELSS